MFWLWLIITLILGAVHVIAMIKSQQAEKNNLPTRGWRLTRDISGYAFSFATFQVGWEFALL